MAGTIKKEKIDILNPPRKFNLVCFILFIILLIGLGGLGLDRLTYTND